MRVTVLKPQKGFRAIDFAELWAHRELLWVLAAKDLKVRYSQTALGIAWAVIQPVMAMVVFSVIFGRWAKFPSGDSPYPVFVYAGLLPWTFFASSTLAGANSILGAGALITKVYFPRLTIPFASAVTSFADFCFSMLVMFGLMLWYGTPFTANLLFLPLFVGMAALAAVGAGTFCSALVLAYRDLRFVVPFMIQIWMYATPVVYPPDMAPAQLRWALFLNPMAGVVEGFRFALLGKAVSPSGIALSAAVAAVFFVGGAVYFRQVEKKFADLL